MFSTFRRKQKLSDDGTGATVLSSPSLPELGPAQGALQWPESLIDVSSIQGTNSNTTGLAQETSPKRSGGASARKTSFSKGEGRGPIPFHKPFRNPPDGPISSLYMSPSTLNTPPQSMDRQGGPGEGKAGLVSKGAPRRFVTQKRLRPAPNTFNVMVVGGQSTGKTSLLRLLLDTSEFSSRATDDQKAAVERFLNGTTPKKTKAITTACVETADSRHEHILLSVVDTPGLDFAEGRELKLDRQVSAILKYVDAQYADTLTEEIKVVRTSKGDQHIHLCIFMIDPSLVMTARARRELSSLPAKTRSDISLSRRPSTSAARAADSDDESDDEAADVLTIAPAELRAMRRIAARCNILPVIGHADTLTDEKLVQVREAIRRGMAEAGLDFGVFGSPTMKTKTPQPAPHTPQPTSAPSPESVESPKVRINGNGVHHAAPGSDEESAEEERPSRSIIKLRGGRHPSVRKLSRSRSRRDLNSLKEEMDDSPVVPSSYHRDSVHNVRFSAHLLSQKDVDDLLPFAFIAPESGKRLARPKTKRPVSMNSQTTNGASRPVSPSSDGEPMPLPSLDLAAHTAGNVHADTLSPPLTATEPEYLNHPPIDPLKGVYIRKYKWGTIDVLDPEHCDFAALRTSILSTNMKALRTRTRHVLYEKYRMEKLLARRATAQITDDQRKQLLEELGL